MNYLAHGYRYLDRPLFVAGTAVPDWLSVADRRVRARSPLVQPVVDSSNDDRIREIGLGILQHHTDDDVFHRCELFMKLDATLSTEFRQHMPDRFDHRPGFLGHIVVELMLDAVIAEQHPDVLDRYYHALKQVDEQQIQNTVNLMASRSTTRLAWFIERFRQERFLYDYASDDGMFFRLNQVLRRVRLQPMHADVISVLGDARQLLRQHGDALLQAVSNSDDC